MLLRYFGRGGGEGLRDHSTRAASSLRRRSWALHPAGLPPPPLGNRQIQQGPAASPSLPWKSFNGRLVPRAGGVISPAAPTPLPSGSWEFKPVPPRRLRGCSLPVPPAPGDHRPAAFSQAVPTARKWPLS
ncbi:Hypothetical predicted protein [Marmota monax]|uniref:Uncharacterized protein n=1 Tax=Marmota monax TaxID=9995 RepID=A0A5E4CLB2_MARMO|nr:Hypothetical predicted protein [Marmota monax]